jgi:hypothetical protein
MKFGAFPEPRSLNNLPSVLVLPIARAIYLFIAVLSLLALVGGILFVAYLQASTAGSPSTVPLPPPYQGSAAFPNMLTSNLDLSLVQARLRPPTNIRFVVTAGTITNPLPQGAVLGHFTADTANQIAAYPEGVSILGGPDAERFARALDEKSKMAGLAATPLLAKEIADALRDIKFETERPFQIRVVMRDQFGVTSAAEDVSFSLKLAPLTLVIPPTPKADTQAEPTEVQRIAREVAKIIEPTVNPVYFTAYEKAIEVPRRCGASEGDQDFLTNYRRAFEDTKSKLTSANIDAFYTGLCAAWNDVLQKQAAAREQAEQARHIAIAHNNDLERRHAEQVFQAKTYTSVTLSVIGGALGVFLSVSLVLAFLAIEAHSRAVRLAMEAMVRLTEQGKSVDSTGSNP